MPTADDLVFCDPSGDGPRNPDSFAHHLVVRVKRAGLPRLTAHGLRHSWASIALQRGIHPKVVQERLGHASIAITLDIYSHAIPALQSEAASQVADLIFGT
jgi:integrase